MFGLIKMIREGLVHKWMRSMLDDIFIEQILLKYLKKCQKKQLLMTVITLHHLFFSAIVSNCTPSEKYLGPQQLRPIFTQ